MKESSVSYSSSSGMLSRTRSSSSLLPAYILSILSITLLKRLGPPWACDSFGSFSTFSFIREAAAGGGGGGGSAAKPPSSSIDGPALDGPGPSGSLKLASLRSFFHETIVVSPGVSSTLNLTRPPPVSTVAGGFEPGPFSGPPDSAPPTINSVLYQSIDKALALKITKMGNKGRKTSSSIPRSSTSQVYKEAIPNVDSPANPTEAITKKLADIQVAVNSSELQNGDAINQDMYKDLQKPGVNPSEKHSSKLKESELQNTSNQDDKISHASKSHSGKQLDNVDGLDMSIQQKGKGVATSRASAEKESLTPRKEGSSVRPKSTNLEKAFKELEKTVAQFRPPSTEPQDQSVKKRLPAEIKLKLARVARIAVSAEGQIPKDVINRLMSIMGHLMHITTLKRNLRAMANMGLSAKQEKDDQIQKMKQEVAEMVKLRTLRMKSKLEQHDADSDDFQEAVVEEREAWKRKFSFDDVLENKICDLYDLYVERLEEDSGPPLRKLYEELASLWPSGIMQNDGIKRAIYRAKDRKGLCNIRKDREKIKKKKVVIALAQDASNSTQPMDSHEKLLSRDRGSKLVSNPGPGAAHVAAAASAKKAPNLDNLKQEKGKKLISSSTPNLGEPKLSSLLPKKKVKRKPNAEVAESKLRLEKLGVSQGGETTQT